MRSEQPAERLLMAASTVGYFDPMSFGQDLVASEIHEEAMSELADDCREQKVDGSWYWTVEPTARRRALRALAETQGRDQLLNAIEDQIHPKDQLGRYLIPAMGGQSLESHVKAGNPDPALLLATRLAADSGVENTEALAETGRRVLRAIELDERQQILDTVIPPNLIGRDDEYDRLLAFLRDRPLGDAVDLFAVTGMGGVGKSALVSTFVDRQIRRPNWPPVVHFDFDRPSLLTGFGQMLTAELSHQLGLCDPSISESMTELRHAYSDAEPNFESGSTRAYSMVASLGERLIDWRFRHRPLIVVLDTFEEVALRGPSVTTAVLDWVVQLRDVAGLSGLRPVLAGRELPDELTRRSDLRVWDHLPLEDLSIKDGVEMLSQLLTEPDIARRAVTVFGGNPLVLKMFNRFDKSSPSSEVEALLVDAENERARDGESYQPGPRGVLAVRFLTDRILNRLSDDLKSLADPGLVLRKVSPELVRTVLAEPCGLGQLSDQEAADMLGALEGHIWLVQPIDGGRAVRHRSDVRRMMLPGTLARSKEACELIHANAIAYYSAPGRAGDIDSNVEADYHRAFIVPQSELADEWITEPSELINRIGADIQDWPVPSRALLRSLTDHYETMSLDEGGSLSGDRLAKARISNVEQSLAHGDVSGARDVWVQLSDESESFDVSALKLDFAECKFDRIVDRSRAALHWYFGDRGGEQPGDLWTDPRLQEHVPWLVALACLATGERPPDLVDDELVAIVAERAGDGRGSSHMFMALAGLLDAGAVARQLVRPDNRPEVVPDISSEAAVHLVQLQGAINPGAVLAGGMYSLEAIRRSAVGTILGLPLKPSAYGRLLAMERADEQRSSHPTLTELNDDLRTLAEISVRFPSGSDLAGLPAHLVQTHRPGRLALLEAGPEWVVGRLEVLAHDVRWPYQLLPEKVDPLVRKKGDHRLIASVVETADRLGLLAKLFDPSAHSPAVIEMWNMVTGFEARLRQART